MRNLLLIEENVTSNIPDEVSSEGFDTLGKTQRISSVHMASYLDAADRAIDAAIKVGEQPSRNFVFDFENSEFLYRFHDLEISQGGNVSRKLEDGVVLFSDVDYLLSSQANGCQLTKSGVCKITSKVAAIQSRRPVTFKLVRKEPSGAADNHRCS